MVLQASCPHSVVFTMGNCRHKVTVLDISLGWCVVTNTRDLQPGNQSPCCSQALWAVITNDLCIRRCRAQSNYVTPVNISDEQPPHYFFKYYYLLHM